MPFTLQVHCASSIRDRYAVCRYLVGVGKLLLGPWRMICCSRWSVRGLSSTNPGACPGRVTPIGGVGNRLPPRAPSRDHQGVQGVHFSEEIRPRHGIQSKDGDDVSHHLREATMWPVAVVAADALRVHDVFGDDLRQPFTEGLAESALKRSDAEWRALSLRGDVRMGE